MSDSISPDDNLEPLDLSKWNEKDRKVIERVRDLLTHLNPARVEEHRKRLDSAVLTADRIDQAAWSECAAASAATFQGSSSSMRLMG